jgi:hypothetical protein
MALAITVDTTSFDFGTDKPATKKTGTFTVTLGDGSPGFGINSGDSYKVSIKNLAPSSITITDPNSSTFVLDENTFTQPVSFEVVFPLDPVPKTQQISWAYQILVSSTLSGTQVVDLKGVMDTSSLKIVVSPPSNSLGQQLHGAKVTDSFTIALVDSSGSIPSGVHYDVSMEDTWVAPSTLAGQPSPITSVNPARGTTFTLGDGYGDSKLVTYEVTFPEIFPLNLVSWSDALTVHCNVGDQSFNIDGTSTDPVDSEHSLSSFVEIKGPDTFSCVTGDPNNSIVPGNFHQVEYLGSLLVEGTEHFLASSWVWSIDLQTTSGPAYHLPSNVVIVANPSPGLDIPCKCDINSSFTLPSDRTWLRDANNNIVANVSATCFDVGATPISQRYGERTVGIECPPVPTRHPGWSRCFKCEGMFYSHVSTFGGVCPTDGKPHVSASGLYFQRFGEDAPGQQGGWRRCDKCQGLFYARASSGKGICPADHNPHSDDGSDHYASIIGDTPIVNDEVPAKQGGWRWCFKCQGMFYARDGAGKGVCPADQQPHDDRASGPYASLVIQTSLPPVIRIDAKPSGDTTIYKQIRLIATATQPGDARFTYQWRAVTKSAAIIHGDTATPDVQFDEGVGPYTFEVTVTNASGLSSVASITITYVGR